MAFSRKNPTWPEEEEPPSEAAFSLGIENPMVGRRWLENQNFEEVPVTRHLFKYPPRIHVIFLEEQGPTTFSWGGASLIVSEGLNMDSSHRSVVSCVCKVPQNETAMMHCDLRVRWKIASDLRFRAAISEPKTPSCRGISGDLVPSTRKSLAIAIVRFWCAKSVTESRIVLPEESFQKRLFAHNSVCSQFGESLFAILAECSQFCWGPCHTNSRGNPSLFWLGGGGGGTGAPKLWTLILWTNWRFLLMTNTREGANREKLTVKKLIDNEMFFFHRLCPLQTVKNRRKPWKNRHQTVKKIGTKNPPFFSPLVFHRLRLLEIQRQMCGNSGRKSQSTDSPLNSKQFQLQMQTVGAQRINSVIHVCNSPKSLSGQIKIIESYFDLSRVSLCIYIEGILALINNLKIPQRSLSLLTQPQNAFSNTTSENDLARLFVVRNVKKGLARLFAFFFPL